MDVLFKPSPLPSENQPNNVNIILRSASFSVILRSGTTKNPYFMRCFAYAQHDGKKEILRCAQDDNKGCSG